MIEFGKGTKIKLIIRSYSDNNGIDIHVNNTVDAYSVCGFTRFSPDDNLYILKTWGNSSGFFSRLGLDSHYLNEYDRIKIVGVDEI
jgi:hypothetical protein